ncbi:HAD-IC family P-type ATPase [Thalassobacillus sp. C254]|uniref:HAD-IC family P-type ATPase n=1 Tax=Thalassobacillus sp. C254 TaxID=1225341 RepID=UPI000A84EBDA|nr:HAD-IC family P-type ATPase [Thalassobacillus sp. C254]
MLSLKANVIRERKTLEIDSKDLIPGDMVKLQTGDKIPADLRLVSCENLKIEESPLTGESTAVEKSSETLPEDTVLGDRVNMAFSGTSVASGTGTGIVTAIGKDTELGKINKSLTEVETTQTPLLQQTARFGKGVAYVIAGLSVFIYLFGLLFRDYGAGELLLAIIGLAVAAIPEGLPAIISIILSIGVQNMAGRKAIVRNLPSVETLGAVSVICSDKTGTLTKNEMTVTSIVTSRNDYEVSGVGYSPKGEITCARGSADHTHTSEELYSFLTCVTTCNEASLSQDENDQWVINGDPTEGCLLTVSEKAEDIINKLPVLSKIPFDSEYKYMAVLAEDKGEKIIFIKGAPDRLFGMAEKNSNEFNRLFWENKVKEKAKLGQRVIGAAVKRVPKDTKVITHADLEEGIVMVGLAGIIDPPREEAIEAIKECKKAGITVKMITGDHKDTAMAIGMQMGLGDGELALEGKEIDSLSDEELADTVLTYDIFARTSPENKLRLVKALQEKGQICAMTGDGVNDAPALKRADIGVAMGIKGTEVAKDASEMVLVDDNFKTIIDAVEEGRRVYDNLKKTILFILPTNGAQAFLIIASILFGTMMPLTPVQILWVNMVIAVTVSLALAFEKVERGAMRRPPRELHTPLLSQYYIFRIIFVALLIGGSTLVYNSYLMENGYSQQFVNSVTLHTIVILQLFHLFNCRSERDFALTKDFFANKAAFLVSGILVMLQIAILYVPFMNTIFGTVPIGISFWVIPCLIGLVCSS